MHQVLTSTASLYLSMLNRILRKLLFDSGHFFPLLGHLLQTLCIQYTFYNRVQASLWSTTERSYKSPPPPETLVLLSLTFLKPQVGSTIMGPTWKSYVYPFKPTAVFVLSHVLLARSQLLNLSQPVSFEPSLQAVKRWLDHHWPACQGLFLSLINMRPQMWNIHWDNSEILIHSESWKAKRVDHIQQRATKD